MLVLCVLKLLLQANCFACAWYTLQHANVIAYTPACREIKLQSELGEGHKNIITTEEVRGWQLGTL